MHCAVTATNENRSMGRLFTELAVILRVLENAVLAVWTAIALSDAKDNILRHALDQYNGSYYIMAGGYESRGRQNDVAFIIA